MTAYEIISIFLGVLSLLIAFGSLLIAIIAFLVFNGKIKICSSSDRDLSLSLLYPQFLKC